MLKLADGARSTTSAEGRRGNGCRDDGASQGREESMARRKIERPIPRIALTRPEAAAACGVSVDHFDRHIRPHLRAIKSGTLTLWPVRELEKWADHEAQMELGLRPGDDR